MESRLEAIDAASVSIVAAFQLASTLNIISYLRSEHAERLEREVAGPLREAIADTIAKLQHLEAELDRHGMHSAWDILERTLDASPAIDRVVNDELWQHVTDVCFAARGELRRVERTMRIGGITHDDRLVACERAHRKLRRALAAVLGALGRARDRTFPVLAEVTAEAETAAAIRRMYTRFRRSLPSCNPGDPASVRRALRYSAVSLAVMFGDSDFADVRTHDRALILQLQSRILRWARTGGSEGDGIQLHRDIVTAADLLRSINLRQELAEHDRCMLRTASTALADDDPAAAITAALPALRALHGRDDALDDLVAIALREPPTHELVTRLRAAVAPAAARVAGPTAQAWSSAS